MTNIKTKLISLALAACMLCAASISVSAAEINQSGGSGSTPVNLTTTNGGLNEDGSGGGTVTPTKLNVTVPTALPLAMSDDGTVKSLQAEYADLLAKKKVAYAEYRTAREEMKELLLHKSNIDRMSEKEETTHDDQKKKHERQ